MDLELKFIDTCHSDPAYSEVRDDNCQSGPKLDGAGIDMRFSVGTVKWDPKGGSLSKYALILV